jgi:ribulose 1,5-bisphosphate synthetase/thiazole synthase
MITEKEWIILRNEISNIVLQNSHIHYEYGEDLYVGNSGFVATKVLEKLVELGVIEVENK